MLSFPRRLRFQAARDPRVASRLLALFTRAVFALQRRRARRLGVADPRTAGVTAVQRFSGALNLNVHFHSLVPDGVFAISGDACRLVPLPAPSDEEVERVLAAFIRKVARDGLLDGGEESEPDDPFDAIQAAEVDRRLRFPDPIRNARRSAFLDGFCRRAWT